MARSRDLTVREVANELQLSEKTVLKLIRSKKLDAFVPGLRAYRIKPESLEAFKYRKSAKHLEHEAT